MDYMDSLGLLSLALPPYGLQGKVVREYGGELPDEAAVLDALTAFSGEIEQIPPMYSAVKKDGVPLHRLARRGEEVERAPKRVTIERIELVSFQPPDVEIAVECGPGTYVRAIAADLGTALGCGAFLQSLRRLRSGPFEITQAVTLESLDVDAESARDARLISPEEALDVPEVRLGDEGVRRLSHGGDVSPGSDFRRAPGARAIARDNEGRLLALVELRADRRLWPLRVLATG